MWKASARRLGALATAWKAEERGRYKLLMERIQSGKELHLYANNGVPECEFLAVAAALRSQTSRVPLLIISCADSFQLTPRAVKAIGQSLVVSPSVRHLALAGLSTPDLAMICQTGCLSRMMTVSFHSCRFDASASNSISRALLFSNSRIKEVLFDGCSMGELIGIVQNGVGKLAKLVVLRSHDRKISVGQLATLGRALRSSRLKELDLFDSHFDAWQKAAGMAFAHCIQSASTLITLKLCHCKISDAMAIVLGTVFAQNTNLQSVDLRFNEAISDSGYNALLDGMSKNTNLKEILLDRHLYDLEEHEPVRDICRANLVLAQCSNRTFARWQVPFAFEQIAKHPAAMFQLIDGANMESLLARGRSGWICSRQYQGRHTFESGALPAASSAVCHERMRQMILAWSK